MVVRVHPEEQITLLTFWSIDREAEGTFLLRRRMGKNLYRWFESNMLRHIEAHLKTRQGPTLRCRDI